MNSFMTVAKFTFMNRFKSKPFLITTIVFAVLLSIMIHLPAMIESFTSGKSLQIGMIGADATTEQQLKSYFETQRQQAKDDKSDTIAVVMISDEDTARAQMTEGELEGYLLFGASDEFGFPRVVFKSDDSMKFGLISNLQQALQAAKQQQTVGALGLNEQQLASLFAPVSFETVQISETGGDGKSESEMMMAYGLVYALMLLLYMGVIGYGNLVATEITAEKNSRVMELLISSVSPIKQMFGKIIGICLLGLFQFVVLIGVAALNLSTPKSREIIASFNLNLQDVDVSLLVYFVIFYILGYLIYATIFAALGSLVSRTEDVGQVIMPVTMLVVVVFLIAMYGLNNPSAGIIVAMSFVPFFTPLVMFLRIGMSEPALWEIGLSIVILAASIYAMGWFAAKIYRVGVLMYGKRPSFKEVVKAMKAMKV